MAGSLRKRLETRLADAWEQLGRGLPVASTMAVSHMANELCGLSLSWASATSDNASPKCLDNGRQLAPRNYRGDYSSGGLG